METNCMAEGIAARQSLWSRIEHWLRSICGIDPHRWSAQDTLHGVERAISRASNGGESSAVLGSGRLTRVWVCSCGKTTYIEPEVVA